MAEKLGSGSLLRSSGGGPAHDWNPGDVWPPPNPLLEDTVVKKLILASAHFDNETHGLDGRRRMLRNMATCLDDLPPPTPPVPDAVLTAEERVEHCKENRRRYREGPKYKAMRERLASSYAARVAEAKKLTAPAVEGGAGMSQRQTARVLGVDESTVRADLRRNPL